MINNYVDPQANIPMSGPFYNSLFSSESSNATSSPLDLQLLSTQSQPYNPPTSTTSTQDAVAQTVDAVRLIIASVLQLRGIVADQQCELDQLRSEINHLRGMPLPIVSPPFVGFESIGVGSSSGLSVSGPLQYVPDAPFPVSSEDQMAVSTPTPTPTPAPPPPIFLTPDCFPTIIPTSFSTPNTYFHTPDRFHTPFPTPDRFHTPFSTPNTCFPTPISTPNTYFPATTTYTPLFPAASDPVTPPQSTIFSTVDPPSRPKHPLPPTPFLWGAPAATPYSRH